MTLRQHGIPRTSIVRTRHPVPQDAVFFMSTVRHRHSESPWGKRRGQGSASPMSVIAMHRLRSPVCLPLHARKAGAIKFITEKQCPVCLLLLAGKAGAEGIVGKCRIFPRKVPHFPMQTSALSDGNLRTFLRRHLVPALHAAKALEAILGAWLSITLSFRSALAERFLKMAGKARSDIPENRKSHPANGMQDGCKRCAPAPDFK